MQRHRREPKAPWRARKEAHLTHLRSAPSSVLRVAAADKLHNLRVILRDDRARGESLWSRFNATRDEILWYHQAMVALFQERDPVFLAAELREVLAELEAAIQGRVDTPQAATCE